jgi:3-methyladenine DNA glycosylase/8-oxoguanine DNA glycosylase
MNKQQLHLCMGRQEVAVHLMNAIWGQTLHVKLHYHMWYSIFRLYLENLDYITT